VPPSSTLKRDGELRGCMGHIEASRPLWQSVREMAGEAAGDPRFAPVSTDEVDALLDRRSGALTPMTPVKDTAEIVIASRRPLPEAGPASGLLCPQVADGVALGTARPSSGDMPQGRPFPGAWKGDGRGALPLRSRDLLKGHEGTSHKGAKTAKKTLH